MKLFLTIALSFLVHIAIAGALVYVPYHLYNTARAGSTENIIWGQIQEAGSRSQKSEARSKRSEGRSKKLESRDRPSGLSGEQQGAQEMPPHTPINTSGASSNPLPQGERQYEGSPIIPPPQNEMMGEGALFIPPPLTGGGEGEGELRRISSAIAANNSSENTGTGGGTGDGTGDGAGDDEKGRVYSIQLKALIDQVKKEIERNKYYPLVAKIKGLEGTVYINFHIGQDGRPGSIAVNRSSGSNVLDAAAVKTIMNLKPFKNINPELRELDINVPITYKLREE